MKKTIIISLAILTLLGCLPKTPKYPFRDSRTLDQEAQKISDALEEYIIGWHKGELPSEIPNELLPKGYDDSRFKNFKLVKPENLDANKIWVKRLAHKIDFNSLYGSFPDPNCTYIVAPVLYAPFGAELKIKGEFPYSRFFDIQVSPALDTKEYRYDKWAGKGEVAIVDIDIEPINGHTNPFLAGAKRDVKNRSYEVTYKMALGNPSKLNKAHIPPYRGQGNNRYGSAIQLQGPWGLDKKNGHGRGIWDFGDVWIRYYGIDDIHFPDGGVKLPEMYFELASGEQFFIIADFEGLIEQSEATMANRKIGNRDPSSYNGKNKGWDKQYGIFLQIAQGVSTALYKEKSKDKEYIRGLDLGVTGRGENQPIPASLEPHATGCNYINYMTSSVSIKQGKVFVLTGKLPTFPNTRKGAKIMQAAQCRYWSMTTYDADFPFSKIKGLVNTSVMDDEIILDENRNYIIAYSRKEDRPKNATKENGITWIDWGTTGTQAFTWRWMSISPDWEFELSPNEINLPWAKTTWSGTEYDPSIIGSNQSGFLQEYHPIRHYMTKELFENKKTSEFKTGKTIWK